MLQPLQRRRYRMVEAPVHHGKRASVVHTSDLGSTQHRSRRSIRSALLVGLLVLLSSGCASHHRPGEPIVDLQGADPVQYEQDLGDCRQFAKQVNVGTRTGAGAVAGAVLGGAIGAVIGDSGTASKGAGVGAIHGGARGTFSGYRERSQVVKSCLRQRGYRVLN